MDVTAGATGAPKFSDILTLFQPGGADSAPTSQRLHQKLPRGYISVFNKYFQDPKPCHKRQNVSI
jgi:hypothetical protein